MIGRGCRHKKQQRILKTTEFSNALLETAENAYALADTNRILSSRIILQISRFETIILGSDTAFITLLSLLGLLEIHDKELSLIN